MIFSGLGKFSENCFLSFLEDNGLAATGCQKVPKSADLEVKKRSWKRRVTVNSVFYFGILTFFAIMNIIYTVMSYEYCTEEQLKNETLVINQGIFKLGTLHNRVVSISKNFSDRTGHLTKCVY